MPGRHAMGVRNPSTTLQELMRRVLYLELLVATQKNSQANAEDFLLTSALHVRENAVKAEIGELKGKVKRLDEHLKDLRRLESCRMR